MLGQHEKYPRNPCHVRKLPYLVFEILLPTLRNWFHGTKLQEKGRVSCFTGTLRPWTFQYHYHQVTTITTIVIMIINKNANMAPSKVQDDTLQ